MEDKLELWEQFQEWNAHRCDTLNITEIFCLMKDTCEIFQCNKDIVVTRKVTDFTTAEEWKIWRMFLIDVGIEDGADTYELQEFVRKKNSRCPIAKKKWNPEKQDPRDYKEYWLYLKQEAEKKKWRTFLDDTDGHVVHDEDSSGKPKIMSEQDARKILKIQPDQKINLDVIRKKFRELVFNQHPDLNDNSKDIDMNEINRAKELLEKKC